MLTALNLTLRGRLSGVTATLRPGEVTAICGPNGAGKSSLLACLAGLLEPDSGEVALGGSGLAQMAPRDRALAIGYLPQTPDVAWDVNVETLVSLGRLPHRASFAENVAAITEAIAAMELQDFRLRPVSRLSGGERARALAARVLAGKPRWLLADEPLANLDLAHSRGLIARLRAQAACGVGVVLVLHDLASAMNHADRVLVMQSGRLVADGPPQEALSAQRIEAVWGVKAQWLGEAGSRALSIR